MSIKLKTAVMKVKRDGQMKDVGMIFGDTAESIAAIQKTGSDTLTEVTTKTTKAISDIDAKTRASIDSIPDDYTELNNKIDELNEDLDKVALENDYFTIIQKENGKYVDKDGNIASYGSFGVTEPIPVPVTAEFMTYQNKVTFGGQDYSLFNYQYAEYDADGNWLRTISGNTTKGIITVKLSEDAKYVRVNYGIENARVGECLVVFSGYKENPTTKAEIDLEFGKIKNNVSYECNTLLDGKDATAVLDSNYFVASNNPITTSGKLVVFAYVRFATGFSSIIGAPSNVYVLKKNGNNFVVDAVIPLNITLDMADKSKSVYQYVEVETEYYCDGLSEIYLSFDYTYYGLDANIAANKKGWYRIKDKVTPSVGESYPIPRENTTNGLMGYGKTLGYIFPTNANIPTKVSQLQNDEGYVKASEISLQPFKNCVGYFDGDSITDQGRYNQTFSDALGLASFVKYGVGGTCIARTSARGTSAVQYTNPICKRFETYGNTADIITILGGTNDYGLSVPLGEFLPNAETDNIDTFYGALNYMIKGIITRFPTKRLFLFTPIQRFWTGTGQTQGIDENSAGHTLKDYCDAIKTVGARYGIPVIDLYANSGFNIVTNANWTDDGLHPNAVGGRVLGKVMADFVNQYSKYNL